MQYDQNGKLCHSRNLYRKAFRRLLAYNPHPTQFFIERLLASEAILYRISLIPLLKGRIPVQKTGYKEPVTMISISRERLRHLLRKGEGAFPQTREELFYKCIRA